MNKPRILILDTYYPDVIRSMPINPAGTYESELQAILNQSFGTADFYSRNLRALGWDAIDVITNHDQLNNLNTTPTHVYLESDVIFLQDLGIRWADKLKGSRLIAGQLSCPWPGDANVRKCDIIFTSFPHYVPRIEALGVKAVYNPLAFDPIVLERLKTEPRIWQQLDCTTADDDIPQKMPGLFAPERIYDCTFVGGVSDPGHWRRGMEVLNAVAEAIPTFKWWGYGADKLRISSALFEKYQGEAWGLDMYRIFCQSKIVLNRHGEVAEGYSNNMRMFEATGCGAFLLTESSKNLRQLFSGEECAEYGSAQSAINFIQAGIEHPLGLQPTARAGQQRTLREHTYAKRMKTVSDTLQECLSQQTIAK